MSSRAPVLHMLCGKAAAGKSTLCLQLARSPGTITIAQDPWMAALYPEELQTLDDYIRLVPRLHAAMGPHIADVLRAGISVVLDWPANTLRTRSWMREIFEAAGADHQLHWLDVPDQVCLERLASRNVSGDHEFTLTEEQFRDLTRWFEPPGPAEGFNLIVHSRDR